MSDVPFGFGPPGREPDDDDESAGAGGGVGGLPTGGFGVGFPGGLGLPGDLPPDLAGKVPLFAELQKLLSWQGGPVNWDLARQLAVSQLAGGHRSPTPGERA